MSQSTTNVPNHIGLILDGNRRWAKEKNLPTLEGHRVGYENLKTIAEHAFNSNIPYVSAYIFSTENWKRSKEEVKYLMGLLSLVFTKYVDECLKNGIRIHWLGTYDNLSDKQIKIIHKALEATKHLKEKHLSLCFNYGGWKEIEEAVKKIVASGLQETDVSIDVIRQNIYDADIPDVDLVIRTSGEQRLSNFMLWRVAYSELIFTDKYWPAFTKDDLDRALEEFAHRQRRFGK